MSLLSSILLGLVQGIAEFLPISSSGHLAIAEHLLNVSGATEIPDFFDVLLHLGTLVAVFVAYWSDIRDMILELISGVRDLARRNTPDPIPPARRMILLIIVGTLPLFLVLPVKDRVEGLSDNLYFVAGAPARHRLPAVFQRPGEKGPEDGAQRPDDRRPDRGHLPGHRHLPRHLPLRHHHHHRLPCGL